MLLSLSLIPACFVVNAPATPPSNGLVGRLHQAPPIKNTFPWAFVHSVLLLFPGRPAPHHRPTSYSLYAFYFAGYEKPGRCRVASRGEPRWPFRGSLVSQPSHHHHEIVMAAITKPEIAPRGLECRNVLLHVPGSWGPSDYPYK